MATYTFRCPACSTVFPKYMTISEYIRDMGKTVICPKCGKRVLPTRLISTSPAILYKGDGFYSTDNRRKGDNESS